MKPSLVEDPPDKQQQHIAQLKKREQLSDALEELSIHSAASAKKGQPPPTNWQLCEDMLINCTAPLEGMLCTSTLATRRWFMHIRVLLNELLGFLNRDALAATRRGTPIALKGVGFYLAYQGAITAVVCSFLDPNEPEHQGNDLDVMKMITICYSKESMKRVKWQGGTGMTIRSYLHMVANTKVKMLGFESLYADFVLCVWRFFGGQSVILPQGFSTEKIKGKTFPITEFTYLKYQCTVLNIALVGVFGERFPTFHVADMESAGEFISQQDPSFFEWAFEIELYGDDQKGKDPVYIYDEVKAQWLTKIEEWFNYSEP